MRRDIKRILAALLLAVAAALATGCARERSWEVGAPAPKISVLDLEGRTVKLSDFKGKPVVLRFFLASGCSTCVASMPKLDVLSKEYRDKGVAVLAVNMGNPKQAVEIFARELGLSYPVLLDPALIATEKYGVKAVPTTYFIDRKGIAKSVVVGEVTQEMFEKTVEGLH